MVNDNNSVSRASLANYNDEDLEFNDFTITKMADERMRLRQVTK
jgi:hypothetical protein